MEWIRVPLAGGTENADFVVTLPPAHHAVHGKSAGGVGAGEVLVQVHVVRRALERRFGRWWDSPARSDVVIDATE